MCGIAGLEQLDVMDVVMKKVDNYGIFVLIAHYRIFQIAYQLM